MSTKSTPEAEQQDAVVTPALVTDVGAVAITATIGGARRIFNLGNGLKCAQVQITFTSATAAMPVSGTLSLPPAIVARMGFIRIIGIPEIQMQNSVGAFLTGQPQYDPVNSNIRLLDPAGAAIAPATFGDGGKIRCLVFGI